MPPSLESSSAGISFHQVTKRYGSVTALDNISLTINSTKTTAIVGPSGCGKSTLLQLVNALQTPDSGSIVVAGHNYVQAIQQRFLQSLRRRMGYCVQHIGLFPHLTVVDNITLLAKLERWSSTDINNRIETLLSLTALDSSLLQRYPHELSGGQQQRAGLCRALMLNPDYLLLDEPFAAVDPITRVDIHEQFQQLQQREQRTTLLVTHDISEALSLADSIVVMKAGGILAHYAQDDLHTLNQPAQTILKLIRHGHA